MAEIEGVVAELTALRREAGREREPFDIMLHCPDAQTVEIRSVWAKRGGEPSVHHAMTAEAPDWALVDAP